MKPNYTARRLLALAVLALIAYTVFLFIDTARGWDSTPPGGCVAVSTASAAYKSGVQSICR